MCSRTSNQRWARSLFASGPCMTVLIDTAPDNSVSVSAAWRSHGQRISHQLTYHTTNPKPRFDLQRTPSAPRPRHPGPAGDHTPSRACTLPAPIRPRRARRSLSRAQTQLTPRIRRAAQDHGPHPRPRPRAHRPGDRVRRAVLARAVARAAPLQANSLPLNGWGRTRQIRRTAFPARSTPCPTSTRRASRPK